MPLNVTRYRLAVLIALVPALTAAKCRKPGPDDIPDVVDQGEVQSLDNPLAVVSISPSSGKAGEPMDARVYGSGFEPGATVRIGEASATVGNGDANMLPVAVPALPEGVYDVVVENPGDQSSVLRSGLRILPAQTVDCSFVRVYFGFDEAGLSEASSAELNGLLDCYRASSATLRLEGHADERGTTDYNLALGSRRAAAVERHLSGAGISAQRLRANSFGEEKPMNRAHTEAAWAENRRVEVILGP